jgi:hypothetical protein
MPDFHSQSTGRNTNPIIPCNPCMAIDSDDKQTQESAGFGGIEPHCCPRGESMYPGADLCRYRAGLIAPRTPQLVKKITFKSVEFG